MSKTVRQMLDAIDQFLATGNRDAEQLWAVLTALRGPDFTPSDSVKRNYTIPIRRAALPLTASSGQDFQLGADFGTPDFVYKGILNDVLPFSHFEKHVLMAVQALGLKPASKEQG